MQEETVLKYLEFLKKECLRHQEDKIITDNEMNQLNIEINRFCNKIKSSSIKNDVKNLISKIDFNLDELNHNHKKLRWLSFFGGYRVNDSRQQENRKNRLLKLYNDLDANLFQLKTII